MRYVSQRTGILTAILAVLLIGLAVILPWAVIAADWSAMTRAAAGLAGLAGVIYAVAVICLYHAFAIGPVRLVAPIIGAFPVLSLGWAAATGGTVAPGQWAAVLAVIAGVALTAMLSDRDGAASQTGRATIWAVGSACGFAVTFALAQAAVRQGADLPVILLTRVAAAAVVAGLALILAKDFRPPPRQLPLLATMGVLDALALALVTLAGSLAHPEYAAVASSTFGLVTVVLGWAVLRESMTAGQWASVTLVFAAIGYLGL